MIDNGDAFFGVMPPRNPNPFFGKSNAEITETIAMIEANMPWSTGVEPRVRRAQPAGSPTGHPGPRGTLVGRALRAATRCARSNLQPPRLKVSAAHAVIQSMEATPSRSHSVTTPSTLRTALSMFVGAFLMITCAGMLSTSLASATELAPENRAQITQIVNSAQPTERCAGQVRIAWVHDLQAKVPTLAAQGKEIQGYAYGVDDGSCAIGVRSDLEPERACTVALHERAHLMGAGHATGDPLMGDTMGDVGAYRDPRCAKVLALRYQQVMEEMWSRTRVTTRVKCKRVDIVTFTCTTTATRGERVQKSWVVRAARGDRVTAAITGAIA